MKGTLFAAMVAQILFILYALLGGSRTTFSLARMYVAIVPVGLTCLAYRLEDRHVMLAMAGFSLFIAASFCDPRRDRAVAALVAIGLVLFALSLATYWLGLATA